MPENVKESRHPEPVSGGSSDAARLETIYRERAERLARRPEGEAGQGDLQHVLVFQVGRERYALPAADIAEVVPFDGCTMVPGAPPSIRGVINLRGQIRVVADLARLLDLASDGDPQTGFVLLLRARDRRFGLRVDRVEEIRGVSPADLMAAEGGTGTRAEGVTRDLVVLLDSDDLSERATTV